MIAPRAVAPRVAALATLALVAIASPARAAGDACSFDAGPGRVVVEAASHAAGYGPEASWATLRVGPGGEILLNGTPCGDATVHTTDVIEVRDVAPPPYAASVALDLRGGPFAPGRTDEPGSSDEIELRIGIGGTFVSPADLRIVGTAGPDRVVLGARGINLNAGEPDGVDVDVDRDAFTASVNLTVDAGPGSDVVRGDGGAGTGAPFRVPPGAGHSWQVRFNGQRDADTLAGHDGFAELRGGGGRDRLITLGGGYAFGGAGHDRIFAGPGDDYLWGGPGHDTLRGGAGMDVAAYGDAPGRARVDLRRQGRRQDTRAAGVDTLLGIEGLAGSRFADVLIGDDGPNVLWDLYPISDAADAGSDLLVGGRGADVLRSYGGGTDTLRGGPGRDRVRLQTRDGDAGDRGIGGSGDDTLAGGRGDDVLAGTQGNDRLLGRAGDDTLDGGPGDDACDGGPGSNALRRCEPFGVPADGRQVRT